MTTRVTALGRGLDESQLAEMEQQETDWDRASALLECLSNAYEAEEIELGPLCVLAVELLTRFQGKAFAELPERGRQRMLGQLVERCVLKRRPGRRKVTPESMRHLVAEVVGIAYRHGHRLTREPADGSESAYRLTSRIFEEVGLELSERTIEGYWQSWMAEKKP